jgi:hypothetical protein
MGGAVPALVFVFVARDWLDLSIVPERPFNNCPIRHCIADWNPLPHGHVIDHSPGNHPHRAHCRVG